MENYVINQTPITQDTFTLNKIGDGRIMVDAVVFQNVKRTPIGEKGYSTDGFYDLWNLKPGGKTPTGIFPGEDWKLDGWETNQVVLMDKYREWLKTLSTDVKWLLIDIENIPYSLMFPDKDDPKSVEKSHRLLRKLHAEALKIRPDLKFSLYCEGGTIVHKHIPNYGFAKLHQEPVNSEHNLLYRKRLNRLTYGISDTGSKVNSKGIFAANNLISGEQYLYMRPGQTKEDILAEAKWLYSTIKSFNMGFPAVYISPMSHVAIPNDKGYHWQEPISVSLAAYHGGVLRRVGFKGIICWGYQSDFASQLTGSTDENIRNMMRNEIYNTKWKPIMEAFYDSYI